MIGSNCTINMSVSSQLNLKVQNKRERKEIENKKEIGKTHLGPNWLHDPLTLLCPRGQASFPAHAVTLTGGGHSSDTRLHTSPNCCGCQLGPARRYPSPLSACLDVNDITAITAASPRMLVPQPHSHSYKMGAGRLHPPLAGV
jgi:hypothetical protein